MILPSVFVQIPTQNAQNLVPSKTNANHSVGRHDEIKAELPIKSEIDNANQSQAIVAARLNKDLPSTSSSSSASKNTKFPSASTCGQSNLMANLVTARPKVKCLKCEQCPFMSISQDGYNNHIRTVHNNESDSNESASNRSFRNKILCPGCENIFYSKMSLKIHLVNDHQMSRPEISQLLESLFSKKQSNKCTTVNAKTDTQQNCVTGKGAEKQKIYLKNVEVLQNPRFNGCQFGVQSKPPTILSPSETQSECSSSLTDEIANNDGSMVGELNFNGMPVRSTFNQLGKNCLYQPIQSFSMVSSTQSLRDECLNITDSSEHMPMNAISPIIEISSITDLQTYRPDSGSSVKFSENFMNTDNIWTTNNTVTTSNSSSSDCLYQSHQMNLNHQSSMKISSNLNETPSVSPLPIIPLNERKKIYIKNIDILKEPLIKPTQTVSLTDPNCRKNTLHLRTVDEVNLLINKVS